MYCRKDPGIDAAKTACTWTAYRKAARKAAARPAPRKGSSISAPDELFGLEEEPVEEPVLEPELALAPLEPIEDESLVLVAERVAVETVPLVLDEPEPVPTAEPPDGMGIGIGMVARVDGPAGVPAGTVAGRGCVVMAVG